MIHLNVWNIEVNVLTAFLVLFCRLPLRGFTGFSISLYSYPLCGSGILKKKTEPFISFTLPNLPLNVPYLLCCRRKTDRPSMFLNVPCSHFVIVCVPRDWCYIWTNAFCLILIDFNINIFFILWNEVFD